MAYKHMDAYIALTGNNSFPLKNEYIDEFKELLYQEFENASDVFTIQEEVPIASGNFEDVVVRINHVIDSDTGEKRGDDFKKILFKELNHFTQPGQQYQFDNNYWLTYNTESIKSLTADALVTRCNNTLRWIDEDGSLNEIPCAITDIIKQTRDYSTAGSSLVIPAGFFEILCQFNSTSNKIKSNQRFLFGNKDHWFCFRVHGAGVQNYRNQKTFDNMSPGIIRIIVGANFVNEQTDDLVNGVCDVNKNIYSLSINNQNVAGNVGRKIQLTSTLLFNGSTTTKSLTWSSDNENVAKIDSNGLLTMIGVGGCEIMCNLTDNPAIFDTIMINVSTGPVLDYEIMITPDKNYILQGDTQVYTAYLWLNGIQQNDIVSFTLSPNIVPLDNYTYTVLTDNSFSITNIKKFLTDSLNVNCVSGSNSKSIDITLRASF